MTAGYTQMLGQQAARLKYLAESFRIPVLVTNQVTTTFGAAAERGADFAFLRDDATHAASLSQVRRLLGATQHPLRRPYMWSWSSRVHTPSSGCRYVDIPPAVSTCISTRTLSSVTLQPPEVDRGERGEAAHRQLLGYMLHSYCSLPLVRHLAAPPRG